MDAQIKSGLEGEIREFIVENFLFGDGARLAGNDSFLQKGIVDSTGMLEIIGFIEEKYGIEVEDNELIPDNLDSVNNLVNYVGRKMKTEG